MGRRCTICTHAERDEIDRRIVSGSSYQAIHREFDVGAEAVRRHHDAHLSPALAALAAQREEEEAAGLVARVEALIGRAEILFNAASEDGKAAQALNVLRELRALMELWGRATGQLDDRPQVTVNLLTAPEVVAAIGVVMAELADLPERRQRIAERLQLEAGSS